MSACNVSSPEASLAGRKCLEVIVTSVDEAVGAERGGADRLEIVSHLDQGGLTPSLDLVRNIAAKVQVPVRAMVREADSMSVSSQGEVNRLKRCSHEFAKLGIEGLVLGFIRDGEVDEPTMREVLSGAPQLSATFHRAFENLHSPAAAIVILKTFPQIDRILVRIREDGPGIHLLELKNWQALAAPQIRFIAGIGLQRELLTKIRSDLILTDVHVGRGVRDPETVAGAVKSAKVAQMKSALL